MLRLFLFLLISLSPCAALGSSCTHEVGIARTLATTRLNSGLGRYVVDVDLFVTETLFGPDGRLSGKIEYQLAEKISLERNSAANLNVNVMANVSDVELLIASDSGNGNYLVDVRFDDRELFGEKLSRKLVLKRDKDVARYVERGYSCAPLTPHLSIGRASMANIGLFSKVFQLELRDNSAWAVAGKSSEAGRLSATELQELRARYDFAAFAAHK